MSPRKMARLPMRYAGIALCLVFHASTHAASVSLEAVPNSSPATVTTLTINPEQGESVAGLQVDILFDPARLSFEKALPGEVSEKAEKNIMSNAVAPGKVRIIAIGFNKNCLDPGVVAQIHWKNADSSAPPALGLENCRLSGPEGQALEAKIAGSLGAADAMVSPASGKDFVRYYVLGGGVAVMAAATLMWRGLRSKKRRK